MPDEPATLTAFDRHSLFEACAREALRLGGDERTAEYFFNRAQTSRVWLSEQGAVTIADMDIADWCSAIAWSAPGIGRASRDNNPMPSPTRNADSKAPLKRKQPRSGARARGS